MDSDQSTRPVGSGPESPRQIGGGLLRQGRYAEAAEALTTAVEADPADHAAWRLLGGALASTGDFATALPAFQRALELAPDSARGHYNLALALQGLGHLADARAAVDHALALDPDYELAVTLRNTLSAPAPKAAAPVIAPLAAVLTSSVESPTHETTASTLSPAALSRVSPTPPDAPLPTPVGPRPAPRAFPIIWIVIALAGIAVVVGIVLAGHGGAAGR